MLRISIGIIFVWFGLLKFFPEYSPAEELASDTISKLTINLISSPMDKLFLLYHQCLMDFASERVHYFVY
jgi:hypothetical protein